MEENVHNYTSTEQNPAIGGQTAVQDDGSAAAGIDTTLAITELVVQVSHEINQAKKQELEDLFSRTVNNPRFWVKPSRIKALEDALIVPVFDDKSLQQFFNHAMDDLNIEAARLSSKEGKPAVLPTEEEGKALAWSRFISQEKKLITRQLKKDGTEVTDEAIQEKLKARLESLPDKQEAI